MQLACAKSLTTTSSRLVAALAVTLLFVVVSCNRVARRSDDGTGPAGGPPKDVPVPVTKLEAFDCRWATGPIAIDGKSDDAAWGYAQSVDHFYLPWLGKNAHRAKSATRAKLLWDREYVYFLAEMDDGNLQAHVTEQDGRIWEDDTFELFFKPALDKPGYYEFEVNAANAVLDMFLPARDAGGYDKFKSDGDFDIKSAVQLRGTLNEKGDADAGWTVEGRIAWKSFLRTGGRPEPGETWTFALCRVDESAGVVPQELSTHAPLVGDLKADFHRVDQYAPIRFVGEGDSPRPPTSRPVGVSKQPPLITSKVVGSPEPPPPYRVVDAYPKLKLPRPVAIAQQPGSDRIFAVVHHDDWVPTQIARFVDDPQTATFEELIKLDDIAYDFAFHPNFASNGYLYVGMNGPGKGTPTKQTRVVRYHVDPKPPYAFDAASATTIMEWESDGHNGGALDFGPDGMLYVTSGDGTSDADRWHSGQDLSRLLSKVLRIDVDHPEPSKQYSVPKDNPFVGQENVRPETWAYGFRNPWRMKFDPANGQLWVTQNGQDQFEQVYLIEKGANYGWSASEGSHPFYPDRHRGKPISPPTAEHPHADARSLSGGIVYHGAMLPDVRGAYIYGDYSTGKIWGVRHDGKRVVWNKELADTAIKITGFGTNKRGELLVLDHVKDGTIYRLEPSPPEGAASTKFPRKLSDSGLFKSVKDHSMAEGILPYSVNAELWSDGAYKERFIAIPAKAGEDRRIGFSNRGGFDFPDETVLVKSFALEAEAGKPASRRWVETRFMTRQQGEWVGYSYAWNADGTDAELVEAGGRDKPFEIRDAAAPGGAKSQTWHYPSRAECMVCHSRVANFVLGTSLVQLNKDHDYGNGRIDNQLRVMEHLGLLRVDAPGEASNGIRNSGQEKGLKDEALDAYIRAHGPVKGQREAKASQLLVRAPDAHPKLANPYDESADLDKRARSYLQSNCANCHVEGGGGNAKMELNFFTPADEMFLIDVPPLHGSQGLTDARLVAPGSAERSVLSHRIAIRGTGQMPPIATSVVDARAVELMKRWEQEMKPPKPKAAAATVEP